MLSDSRAYATIPVGDLAKVRSFYLDTLGLKVLEDREEELMLECADGTAFAVFVSQGRTSGSHTQMSFMCDDIDAEVADLRTRGVRFEVLEMPGATGQAKVRSGHDCGSTRAAGCLRRGRAAAGVSGTDSPSR